MKKSTVAIAVILFISSANAEADLTNMQRDIMLRDLPDKLAPLWIEPNIVSCWNQAKAGSDKALSALYLIATGRETIINIAEKRKSILISSKTHKEVQLNMKKSFSRDDYNRLRRAIIGLPKSLKYCEALHSEIESNNTRR